MPFFASLEGATTIRSRARDFVPAFMRRIEAGLLVGVATPRSNYAVSRHTADAIAFRAADWSTALAVGLNDVDLTVSDGSVRYSIRYPRWATFVLALSATLGIFLMVFFLVFDIAAYLERHPVSRVPGLSLRENVAVAWGMALFWGFAWPWLLIVLHKGPLRHLMETIIAQVDREATAPGVSPRVGAGGF